MLPDNIIEEDYEETTTVPPAEEGGELQEETIVHKANLGYAAILRLKVQQREEEEEVPRGDDEEGKEDFDKGPAKTVTRMVDEDQQGKALAIQTRDAPTMGKEMIYSINEYAGRAYREHFIEYVHSTYPEFFDDNEDQDLIT